MQLFILRNYAGVAAGWRAGQTGPGPAMAENSLRRFGLTVRWEYALALVRTLFDEVSQNVRVTVWPTAIITYRQERRRVITSDERAVNFMRSPH